jgi:F-type H+-transporting ATPase subunit b
MELDLTTFVLEVVNFLVLLWLLKRFLYKPVQSALEARAQTAAKQAEELRSRGAALDAAAAELAKQQQALQATRDAAERELANDVAAQRQKRLTELAHELAAEREKANARATQEQARSQQQAERELRQRAGGFVADYLQRLASAPVEAALMELFLADLAEQSEQARAALRDGWSGGRDGAPTIDVSTAYAPPAPLRERVEAHVSALMGQPSRTEWRIEPALLAGIRVHLPGHQLEASLRRGVDAFVAESA